MRVAAHLIKKFLTLVYRILSFEVLTVAVLLNKSYRAVT